MVTLPGAAFFPLSIAFLLFRAVVWGELLAFTSTAKFIFALPTLVLEGEAYVLAAVAGTVVGLSWIKPKWVFKGEVLSRLIALKRSFKEAGCVYLFVALFLFVAAFIETVVLLIF